MKRSRSPSGTSSGRPPSKATQAASSWTFAANRRGPARPTTRPSRPGVGPAPDADPVRVGQRQVDGVGVEHQGRRVDEDRDRRVPGQRSRIAAIGARRSAAARRPRAPGRANGGVGWSEARWRRSDAWKSRSSLPGRAATTIPRTPIARARVSASASIRDADHEDAARPPDVDPARPELPERVGRELQRGRAPRDPAASAPRIAGPAARIRISPPGTTSMTSPPTGDSSRTRCSPVTIRQRSARPGQRREQLAVVRPSSRLPAPPAARAHRAPATGRTARRPAAARSSVLDPRGRAGAPASGSPGAIRSPSDDQRAVAGRQREPRLEPASQQRPGRDLVQRDSRHGRGHVMPPSPPTAPPATRQQVAPALGPVRAGGAGRRAGPRAARRARRRPRRRRA